MQEYAESIELINSSNYGSINSSPNAHTPPSAPPNEFSLQPSHKKAAMKLICAISFLLATLSLLAPGDAQASVPYYAPGNATWLGSKGTDRTPKDYASFFPIVYVIMGLDATPHVRVIVGETDDCPSPLHVELLDEDKQILDTRTLGNPIDDAEMPYKFPVRVCELIAHKGTAHRQLLEKGELSMSWKEKSYVVPRVKSNPQKYLLTGDTGLRLKPTNLGLGKLGDPPCDAPEVYGIHQCYLNFTEDDLTQEQTGSFQGLDEWVFKDLADSAASKGIDMIVYVGDYLYRQGPCPLGNIDSKDNENKDCSAVNTPEFASPSGIAPDKIMNFIPGEYGDNWWGWWADFFEPAMNLLQAAPIIPTRGNHEICARGGYGYFMFLSPVAVEDYCLDNFPVYNIPFEHEQFVVMDDSIISPLFGGVDSYTPGQCPGIPESGTTIPVQEDRNKDTSDDKIQEQLDIFTKHFKDVEEFSQKSENNFYVGHRPIFGIGCNASSVVTLDWTLQQSLGPNTLDRFSGIITGHMHWLEALQFENDMLPPQMVVGNGGTKLIDNYIDQSSIPTIDLHVGKPEYNMSGKVKKGITASAYGYAIMERLEAGNYEVTFHTWREESKSVEPIDFSLDIPKGPRRGGSGSGNEDSTEKDATNHAASLCIFVTILANALAAFAVSLASFLAL